MISVFIKDYHYKFTGKELFIKDYHYKFTGKEHCGVLTNMLTGKAVLLSLDTTLKCNKSNKNIIIAISDNYEYLDSNN